MSIVVGGGGIIAAESVLQLFEALTGESWTGNIWNSMAAVGPAACLFWIAWDIIGHKILLNLFLAILINNFQDQEVWVASVIKTLTLKPVIRKPYHWSQDPAQPVSGHPHQQLPGPRGNQTPKKLQS